MPVACVEAQSRGDRRLEHRLTRYFTQRRAVRRGLPPQVVPVQFRPGKAADMPALGFAALRHVVNSRDVR
jgi:hypothetical protein